MAIENPLETLLPDSNIQLPYSEQEVQQERDRVTQKTEQVAQSAEQALDQIEPFQDILNTYNSQLEGALANQQKALEEQARIREQQAVAAANANKGATQRYERGVLSKEAQETLAREQEEYLEAQQKLQDVEDKMETGGLLDKVVGFFQKGYYEGKVKREQEEYQNVAINQAREAQSYVGMLETNQLYGKQLNAVDMAAMKRMEEVASAAIDTANVANDSIGRVFGNVARKLGIQGEALKNYEKRLKLMEDVNATTKTEHSRQLQIALQENALQESRIRLKGAKKKDEAYQLEKKNFINFYTGKGKSTEEAEQLFAKYIRNSVGENQQQFGDYAAHIAGSAANDITQPATSLYNKTEAGSEMTAQDERTARVINAAISERRQQGEAAWKQYAADNNVVNTTGEAKEKWLKENGYALNPNDPNQLSEIDAVTVRYMNTATAEEQLKGGIYNVPAAEDLATSENLSNEWKSYLPPALAAAVENGEIPEDLEITSDTDIKRKPSVVAESVFKNVSKSLGTYIGNAQTEEELTTIDQMLEQEATKIAAYYKTAERLAKGQYDYASDFKFDVESSIGVGISESFDFTNQGQWSMLLKKKLQQLRNQSGSIAENLNPSLRRAKQYMKAPAKDNN